MRQKVQRYRQPEHQEGKTDIWPQSLQPGEKKLEGKTAMAKSTHPGKDGINFLNRSMVSRDLCGKRMWHRFVVGSSSTK
jgi:hypothetical protein